MGITSAGTSKRRPKAQQRNISSANQNRVRSLLILRTNLSFVNKYFLLRVEFNARIARTKSSGADPVALRTSARRVHSQAICKRQWNERNQICRAEDSVADRS